LISILAFPILLLGEYSRLARPRTTGKICSDSLHLHLILAVPVLLLQEKFNFPVIRGE
jgi:hypothetical protein